MTETYRCIVFDLDDTLLDTHGRLVPQAAREACQAMVDAGLNAGPAECFAERARFIHRDPRGNVYQHLVETYGVRDQIAPETVIEAGFRAFHNRRVEKDIQLFDGARALLDNLGERYRLYLVTSGNEGTQRSKVALLGIEPSFARVYYVDPSVGQSKAEAFQEILRLEGGEPHTFLSVGNRVDTDLAPAKDLGWQTCWVRVGEYAHLLPSHRNEQPDYEVRRIQDLGQTCRL